MRRQQGGDDALAAAANNGLLAEFMRSLGQHEKIADAIRNGDPKAAASATRRHVQTVSKVRLLTWDPRTD